MTSVSDLVRGMRDTRLPVLPVLLTALLGAGIFAFLTLASELDDEELDRFDQALLLFFRDPADRSAVIGPAWLEQTVVEITALGGYPILTVMVVSVVGFLFVAGKFGPALFVLASIVSGTAVGHLLKLVYDRPRPDVVEHLVTIHTASFPSGHATMSALVYLTLASLIMRMVDSPLVRGYVLAVAILLTLAVGTSRIYLGVHWPSDVAAGWALGVAWASLSWLLVTALRAYRKRGEGDRHVR